MKILHVTQGYWPAIGGTEILMQRISEELHHQFGDDVTVFTTNCYSGEAFFAPHLPKMPVGEELINGVRVRRFAVNSQISWAVRKIQGLAYRLHLPGNQYLRLWAGGPFITGLRTAIEQAEYDVAAASSFPLMHMFAAVEGAHRSGRPCVLYGGIHPQDLWGFDRPMIYDLIRKTDAYIAYTSYEADYLVQRGVPASKIAVVGAGVDPGPFASIDSSTARQQMGLPADVPLVGFIGQIGGHKGVDALLRAIPLVWQSVPDAHFLIAGARTLFCDELERTLARWTAQQQDRVKLYYNFKNEEKAQLFAALDVFAYPSGYESFGIAFLEAWAARKPVIGCWRGAVPWVVSAGHDGLLTHFQDENSLAGAISLLLQNPSLRAAMGEAGYIKATQRYSWPEIGRRFRAVYQTVVKT